MVILCVPGDTIRSRAIATRDAECSEEAVGYLYSVWR